MEIENDAFLVTGGGSGLGAATARLLAESGGKVLIADVDREAGESTASGIGGAARFAYADVTDEESVQSAVNAALDAFGILRGVVNCAGVGPAMKVLGKKGTHPLEDFAKTVEINLIGTFNVVRLAAAAMAENEPTEGGERGVIVNTATIAPGIFDTPMLAALPEQARDSLGKQIPFPPRLGKPEEYAALVKHIIENEMLNGEVIRLDGGIRMAPR